MKTLKAAICAIGLSSLLIAGAGCGSDLEGKMKEFADKMCECKDAACAEKVQKEMAEWAGSNKEAEPSADLQKKLEPHVKKMMECAMKAAGAGGAGGGEE